jgi:MoaA/NifB/PqqE/SkfB family radical SAM enzyme
MEDTRPKEYKYYNQLIDHIKDKNIIFNNGFIYPRQFEIHLPSNHKQACNLSCPHCAGKLFKKELGNWELTGLHLLDNLQGDIPFHIYGGAYTEPLMNPYYLTFLSKTKEYNNHFGMHINGTQLNWLEDNLGFLTELHKISTDNIDYLSISIDAGTPLNWAKTKGTNKNDLFWDIIHGTGKAIVIRNQSKKKSHAIRWCYLISKYSETDEDIKNIVSLAKSLKIDSLRFSIPFDNYNKSFDNVLMYKHNREDIDNVTYQERLKPYLSQDINDIPYIFYTEPEFTNIERFTFDKCAYGYYQITLGADGYFYKCSTVATPTAQHCRLGKITDNIKLFQKYVKSNQSTLWDCKINCFEKNLRCNRMGLEINSLCQ